MPGRTGDFDVNRLAGLARLTLDPDEQLLYTQQLADILAFAAQVLAIDTTGIPPTTHALAHTCRERDDDTAPSLEQATVVGLAPDADPETGLLRVPRVIGR